ncbi:MAG: DegT/DnrJ/EryC1/StrS family aminotransferase [bacterium]|nr:DegT/DnrJ/EryC1/StrS family aminotransferase [bacterium]
MIPFLSQKQINYEQIAALLSESYAANHYTNNGPLKNKLELVLGKLFDNDKLVLCCSNGTTALHAIMYLCTSKYNVKNWVTPAFTFPSCVVGHNFNIDILDIDPHTYTLPLNKDLLAKYDGVIITNLFGSYVNLSEWSEFCKDNNKILIFDNAASPLSMCDNNNICNFGDYVFGSLHHTKYLGFGEGGFIVCPKEDYNSLNSITNFGFNDKREYNVNSSNFKMSDVTAAFILNHISNYDLEAHIKNQDALVNGMADMKHVVPFNYKPQTVYNTFPVIFNKPISESYFYNLGIRAHKYYKPLISAEHANYLYDRIINFPLHLDLSCDEISHIIKEISNA